MSDLMDRSRIALALPTATYASGADQCAGASIVIVDLGRHAGEIARIRVLAPEARIVAFGSHVDTGVLARARADGADRVLARSAFFRSPAAAVGEDDGPPGPAHDPRAQ